MPPTCRTLYHVPQHPDLFAEITRDAGKGARQPQLPPANVVACRQCNTPVESTNVQPGGRCQRCAWIGAGEAKKPWQVAPADRGVLGGYVPATAPFDHQLSALAGLQRLVRALLMEMGTGKTWVIIADWAMRVLAGEVRDLVVIAPKGVYRNWEGKRENGTVGELGVHLAPELLERTMIATWRSGNPHAKRRVAALLANTDPKRARVLLVNVESLSVVQEVLDAILEIVRHRRAVVVVDESTRIRSDTALRTKAALSIAQVVPERHKRIMTGLVTPRSPLDLYSQFEFISPTVLGFHSYFGFKARHAITRKIPMGPPKLNPRTGQVERRAVPIIVGFRHLAELRDKIAYRSFRVLKEECLDLPPKLFTLHDVDLTPEQTRIYTDIVRTAQAELPGGDWVYATETLPRLIRLQQVLCGFVKDEEGKEHDVPSHRLDQLVELLGDHEGKAIVWAPYVRSLREIYARLNREFGKLSAVRYWGEVRDDERLESINRFQNDAGTRFFVSNQSTGGLGITLTAASLVVYYANSPDLEHRLQSEDRPHRAGLRHPVTYVDMCAQGTIDVRWIETLRRKMDLADALTGDQPRAWLVPPG